MVLTVSPWYKKPVVIIAGAVAVVVLLWSLFRGKG